MLCPRKNEKDERWRRVVVDSGYHRRLEWGEESIDSWGGDCLSYVAGATSAGGDAEQEGGQAHSSEGSEN